MFETKSSKDQFKNQRAFIVGNGPSLAFTDLDKLNQEISLGSNGVALVFEKTKWRPTIYSCIDSAVLVDRMEEINGLILELTESQFYFPKQVWNDSNPPEILKVEEIIYQRKNTTFFDTIPHQITNNAFTSFSPELEKYLVTGTTVTVTLIQLAVLMGCNPIYLVGCDSHYVIPENAREKNADSDRVDKVLVLDEDNDPNHFDPRYFGKDRLWHTPNVHLMIQQYEKVKEACDQRGFEIYNATIGGKLEVFPRVKFDSLF